MKEKGGSHDLNAREEGSHGDIPYRAERGETIAGKTSNKKREGREREQEGGQNRSEVAKGGASPDHRKTEQLLFIIEKTTWTEFQARKGKPS